MPYINKQRANSPVQSDADSMKMKTGDAERADLYWKAD